MNTADPPSRASDTVDLETLTSAFSALVDAHPDAAYLLDLDGRFLAVNTVLCDTLDARPDELLGRAFDDEVAVADIDFVREKFAQAVGGATVQYEANGRRPDGSIYLVMVTNIPVSVGGSPAAVLGFAIDVTQRSDAFTRSRASEDMLRLAGRMARFGGWSVDAVTRRISFTDDALRMFGVSPDIPLTNAVAWSLHAPGDRDRLGALLERCLDLGEAFDTESTMITATGTPLSVRTIGEAELGGDGAVRRVHGAVWDISDLTLERNRSRDLDERLTASLRTISDGLIFLDASWIVTFANPTAEQLLGQDAVEMIGNDLWSLHPSILDTPFEAALRRSAEARESVIHEEWIDRTARWIDVTIYPVETGVVLHLRDATDDVDARERERETTRRLEEHAALLEIARDAVIVRSLDHRVQFWNRSAAELYEIPAVEAIGRPITELIYDEVGQFEAAAEHVMREGHWAGELVQRSRSGRSIVADCRWQLVYDDAGDPRAVLCVNSDITAYRSEQDSQARSQRMESLGTLAGGIAHDLNNVLTPILMSAQLLAQDELDSDRLELLTTLEASAKRGAEMVRQVLAFARGVEGRRDPVPMDDLLDDVVAYARGALPPKVRFSVTRPDALPATTGDVTQFMQVLINLLLNARDAMPEGGRLDVVATLEHFDTEVASIGHVAKAGDYVVLSVEDSGHGMTSDVMTKVFEPFYTTKDAGHGTGLGLSTTLAIVRSHEGFIQVSSRLERGTTFRLGLPVSRSTAPEKIERPAGAVLPIGMGELVLVVDDEEFIRKIACQTLEAHGYRTLHASHGREAIDLIEAGEERIDVVLTDMMMPVMDGAMTTAYLEEHHPDIPIIATSGLASNSDSTGDIGMGVARFLPKPYTTSMLLRAVRDTLRESPSRGKVAE